MAAFVFLRNAGAIAVLTFALALLTISSLKAETGVADRACATAGQSVASTAERPASRMASQWATARLEA
jgi:hypothetical protein